jgi:hypothetical protein
MADGESFHLLRGDDLLVLGVTSAGCVIEGDELLAVTDPASITLTLPPQAIAETKRDDAVVQGAALAARSTLAFAVPVGTRVPLTVGGILAAVSAAAVTDAAIEAPFGLVMRPIDVAGSPTVATAPIAPLRSPAGVDALWQLTIKGGRDFRGQLLEALGGDEALDVAPLSAAQRQLIVLTGERPRLERLRLSTLGASLRAVLATDLIGWDHDMALGRDGRVRFEERGVLHPFGHRATLVQTVERVPDGNGAARLVRRSVLTVAEPIRSMPADGTVEARRLPFHEIEMLTTSVPDVVLDAVGKSFVFPDETVASLTAAQDKVLAEDVAQAERAAQEFKFPTSVEELANHTHFDGQNARDLIVAQQSGTDAEVEELLARVDADFAAIDRAFPPDQRNTIEQLAALGLSVAVAVVEARGRADALAARIRDAVVPVPIASKVMKDGVGTPALFVVRAAGRLGDVSLVTPMLFVRDFTVPEEPEHQFPGYRSLTDVSVAGSLPIDVAFRPIGVRGVPIDVVRRNGEARPTDIPEVHGLVVTAAHVGDGFRPFVDTFDIAVPELRALVPDLPVRVPARLSAEFLDGTDTRNPIRLDPPLPVNFDSAAERGGGLLQPGFVADRISETFGPIDRRMLDPGAAAAAAFAPMRLFGRSLAELLPLPVEPPSIVQTMEAGVPRWVKFTWELLSLY